MVDQPPDPDLYRRVIEAFPEAWLEDPALTEETRPVLGRRARPHHLGRADPLHRRHRGAARSRPGWPTSSPRGSAACSALFDAYDYLAERGIRAYGGGQFELGPGRGQIQYLASLFHPDTPNDTSPSGFHSHNPPPGLPTSPLEPQIEPTGFRWR